MNSALSPAFAVMRMSFVSLGCFVLIESTNVAAQSSREATFELPQDPRQWLNTAPISVDSMRGKAIVLYFYEEGCPRCRERWPSILDAAKQAAAEPVMLIAVNSGNPTPDVTRYLQQNQITVPVIVDTDRSFERAAGVPEISLNNIFQARIVGPEGTIINGNGGDIPATLANAAGMASWNINPSGMPANLMATWKQIEFGDFRSASKSLQKARVDRNSETKAAAESLQNYVDDKIKALADKADAAKDVGDIWQAYKLYEQIATQFNGYELSESAITQQKQLQSDDKIQLQVAAMKQWAMIQKLAGSSNASPVRLKTVLNKLIEKYPDTEAADLAQVALTSLQQ